MNRHRRPVVTHTLAGLAALASLTCLVQIVPASAAPLDDCTATRSASDFNGDGYDDAAVGDPYATVNGKLEAGSVTVLFGNADGRIGNGARQVITQTDLGDTPEAGDHFGFDVVLASADIDNGCADLLVGVPGEDLSAGADTGLAYLISDLPNREGTPAMEAVALTQDDSGGTAEAGDEFGYSVAIMGLNQEFRRRVIVGAPGENDGAVADAGAVNVFEVDDVPERLGELRQGQRGPLGAIRLPGTPQRGDRFGSSLALGVVDLPEWSGNEVANGLMIGAPGDTVSGHPGAGSVMVLQEKFEAAILISQDSAGVPGAAEAGDGFGYSLAFSARTTSTPGTLAVGAPTEDIGAVADAGSVTLLSNVGEQFVAKSAIHQDTEGAPGKVEAGDRFGFAVAVGSNLLYVGVPTEDVGSIVDAGSVQPVRIRSPHLPVEFLPAITENAPGTAGSVGTANRFGRSIGSMSGQQEKIVTISSPYAQRGSVYVLTDVTGGSARSWVAAAGSQRFGWSVSN